MSSIPERIALGENQVSCSVIAGGGGDQTVTTKTACICNRPAGIVLCQNCGNHTAGRVQTACPVHIKRLPLMDQSVCSRCFAIGIVEVPVGEFENAQVIGHLPSR